MKNRVSSKIQNITGNCTQIARKCVQNRCSVFALCPAGRSDAPKRKGRPGRGTTDQKAENAHGARFLPEIGRWRDPRAPPCSATASCIAMSNRPRASQHAARGRNAGRNDREDHEPRRCHEVCVAGERMATDKWQSSVCADEDLRMSAKKPAVDDKKATTIVANDPDDLKGTLKRRISIGPLE